jgi:N-acetylneuraminic acid mutarotase
MKIIKLALITVCIVTLQTKLYSQTWAPLASLPVGLAFPVVVELNGEIHVIGGGGPAGATDLHLRYKPLTNTWDTLAPVPYLAQQPAGAVLNGKIHYFGGGYPNSGTPLDSHYAYDPLLNSWSVAASLPIPRVIMEAASINGKLYALSGQPDKTRVDEYDPSANAWTSKNPLPDMDFWYSAIVVKANEMFRFGGGGYLTPVKHVAKYDPGTDLWITLTTLPVALHAPAGTASGGLIYIGGGYNGGNTDVVQTFDESTLAFNTVSSLPVPIAYHEMVTIDTCIYSVGGDNASSNLLFRYCNPVNVSVNVINLKNTVSVSPNPFSDKTHLYLDEKSITANTKLTICDISGNKVKQIPVKNSVTEIRRENLARGIYLYKIMSENTYPVNGKIIIQ